MTAAYRLCRWPADDTAPPIRPSPVERATALLTQRRQSIAALGPHRELAVHTGWDVMLFLFAHDGDGSDMTLDRVADGIDAPPAVIDRWVGALVAGGLAVRRPDADATVRLTGTGSAILERYLQDV